VILMVETASALDDLDALLGVPGVDGIYVGPGDLALSLNLHGEDDREELRGVLSSIVARAVVAKVPVGVHTYNGEDAAGYSAEGATIVTVGVDAVLLGEGARHQLGVARRSVANDELETS
jgi:4-hydroxy-2-oxoheptanedioate aldolase